MVACQRTNELTGGGLSVLKAKTNLQMDEASILYYIMQHDIGRMPLRFPMHRETYCSDSELELD